MSTPSPLGARSRALAPSVQPARPARPARAVRLACLALAGLGCLGTLGSLGCAASDPVSTSEDVTATERGVVGGTPASAYTEAVLVDMLVDGKLASHCSGALIAKNAVLTAGHCVYGYDGWRVEVPSLGGATQTTATAVLYDYFTDAPYVDPTLHDVALVFLDQGFDLPSYPKLGKKKLANGTRVRNVGRIDDGSLSQEALFVGPSVKAYDGASYGFKLSYVTSEIIESGDSGGPVFLADGASTRTLVAVNSGGGGGKQVLARVDLLSVWIEDQLAKHPPASEPEAPVDPCQGYDWVGGCQGSTVVWCEGEQLKSIACAGAGQTCGYKASAGYYDCVD